MNLRIGLTPNQWVAVGGDGEVAGTVAAELADVADDSCAGNPLYTFEITAEPAPVTTGPRLGDVRVVQGGVAWNVPQMDYELVVEATPPLKVTMHVGHRGPPFSIPRDVFRFVERTAMSWPEAQAYHAVLVLEFLALLTGQVGVLHASAVERDGRILALTSAGGVGKTTSACRLVAHRGFRHIADDVLLVDAIGGIRRSVRKLMVYPYNIAEMPHLEAMLRQTSVASRMLWDLDRILGLGRRRRRMDAHSLFGGRVAKEGALRGVVFLRRAHTGGIQFHDIRAPALAERVNEIIAAEFTPFFNLLRVSTALIGDEFHWSPKRTEEDNVANLTRAFDTASILRIADLGLDFDPTESLAALIQP